VAFLTLFLEVLQKFFDQFRVSNCVNLSHPKYRSDIDGLRAVAILMVVFFFMLLG